MDKTFQLIKDHIGIAGITLFVIGLLFSPVILSIAIPMICLQVFIKEKPVDVIKNVLKDKFSLSFVAFYIWILIAGFYTQNQKFYIDDILLKLPLLLMPFGLVYKGFYKQNALIYILVLLNALVFLVGTASFINFIMHREELVARIMQAKAIPIVSGINHIYFSIILSFSVVASIHLNLRFIESRKLKVLNWFFTILNLVYLHVIAARTGLLGFYLAVLIFLIYWAAKNKRYVVAMSFVLLILLTGMISVKYIKSLNNRYLKTVEDISVYRKGGNINHYSISMRLEYWEKSFKVFLSSPLIGVGKADVKAEMKRIFREENSILEEINWKDPHNQYTQILAGHGIIGFAVFLLIIIFAIRKLISKGDIFLLFLVTILLFSFFFESVLERQVGLTFFAFFWIYFYYRPDYAS